MSTANGDPRVAEILRRRAEKVGVMPTPTPEPRRLDDAGKAEIRRLAAEHPEATATDLAVAFEALHGWRPSCQGIGKCLTDPAPRRPSARPPGRPARDAADPAAEVEAIAALSRALAPLSPAEVRRVLDWARARFQAEGGTP